MPPRHIPWLRVFVEGVVIVGSEALIIGYKLESRELSWLGEGWDILPARCFGAGRRSSLPRSPWETEGSA